MSARWGNTSIQILDQNVRVNPLQDVSTQMTKWNNLRSIFIHRYESS